MHDGRGDGGALDKGGKRVGDRIGWGIGGCRRTGLSIGGGSERVGERYCMVEGMRRVGKRVEYLSSGLESRLEERV